MKDKIERIKQKIKSADFLIEEHLYLDAMSLYWQASRDYLLFWLTKKKIVFNSTNEALKNALLVVDRDTMGKIIQIEIIGTLAEWDEFFLVTKDQMNDFKSTCLIILTRLDYDYN